GREPPGIITLVNLIDQHTTAFEYDWRTRFGLPLRAVFTGDMTWREAWKLTLALLGDPSSRVAASVAGWSEPWDREALILADLYDRFVEANTAKKDQGKIKPYPRPFDTREKQRSS